MREIIQQPGEPFSFILATDAAIFSPDYCNDHAWELAISAGEPSALVIQTSFGCRARMMRIFPVFSREDQAITNPEKYYRSPLVSQLYPNYASLTYTPFQGIDVQSDYWVPDSHTVAGRIRLSNATATIQSVRMALAALMIPIDQGTVMQPRQIQVAVVLAGQVARLHPVLFMTGGPTADETNPYPALAIDLALPPGSSRQFTWAQASLDNTDASFEHARRTTARPWEAEVARIEMTNANRIIDIETGDRDWDIAFFLSQRTAYSLFFNPTQHLPHASFVNNRLPDLGFSLRGDGLDYESQWNGQTPLDALYLASLVLPGSPELAKGLARNFLATQTENGEINAKPGLSGQRSLFQATPVIASLVMLIYQHTRDQAFLNAVFPGLLRFIDSWFTPAHDRDGDGLPEWDHAFQSGFEDNPIFDRWHGWGKANDITYVESVSLGSMLYRELDCLVRLAQHSHQPAAVIHRIEKQRQHLGRQVESCWDSRKAAYCYRDRETHLALTEKSLTYTAGSGVINVDTIFTEPHRLAVHILTNDQATRLIQIFIHGKNAQKEITEQIGARDLVWVQNKASVVTRNAFTTIQHIDVKGLAHDDEFTVRTVDTAQHDITALLPLWAKIPTARRASTLLKSDIMTPSRFNRPYGLPALPWQKTSPNHVTRLVHPIWNWMIGEGLLLYGFKDESAALFTRLMKAITSSLNNHHSFYSTYDCDTGESSGDRDSLAGLAPLGWFFDLLGIRILSQFQVLVRAGSPFPWPITLRFRGMTILVREKSVLVTFPDGQYTTITGSDYHMVSLN